MDNDRYFLNDQRYVVIARQPPKFRKPGVEPIELVKSYPCIISQAISALAYCYSRFPNTEFYLAEVEYK